jgi:hypothetical protein
MNRQALSFRLTGHKRVCLFCPIEVYMLSKTGARRMLSISLLGIFILSQVPDLFAQAHNGRPGPRQNYGPKSYYTPHYAPHGKAMRGLPNGYLRFIMDGLEYYYWEGMFYRMRANQYIVVSAPVGAVVTAIPQGSQPVVVDGVSYYNINGVTYMATPEGYKVVPQPKKIVVKNYIVEQKDATDAAVIAETSLSDTEDSLTVNVPNSKGGYTPVTLKKYGKGFIGPQGEYYKTFPKVEQLRVMYAK